MQSTQSTSALNVWFAEFTIENSRITDNDDVGLCLGDHLLKAITLDWHVIVLDSLRHVGLWNQMASITERFVLGDILGGFGTVQRRGHDTCQTERE